MTDTLSSTSAMQPVSIVGAGNWLIMHDRIGPKVLGMIEGRYGAHVELCDAGSASLALLDFLHGQDLLIVVDACVLGGEPGQVRKIEPDLDISPQGEASVHQIGPVETLVIAKRLYPESLPRRQVLVLVETNDLDEEGEEKACQKVVEIIDDEIRAWQDAQAKD